jgi:hypothetical protein
MSIRYRILAFAAALIVQMQSYSTAASVMKPERTADIIGAQLHRRGVACTAPRSPLRHAASVPDESVWTIRCNEASYRVRLNPGGRKAEITPISIGTAAKMAAPSFEVSAKRKHHAKTHWWDSSPYIPREPRYPYPHANGWYPHDADKLPIGSGEWWRQMLREDRVRN